MASKLRPALVALPLAVLIALTGCTAQTIPGEGKSSPEASSSEKPSSDFISAIPADELGLVLPGDAAKDDEGSFRKAVLNRELAASKYMTLATAPNAAELKAAGYSDEDLIAAQESAYSTLVEFNLDGPLLETDTTTLEWFEAGGRDIFGAVSQEMIHATLKEDPTTSLAVQGQFAEPLVRDGDLRIKGVDISTDSIGLQDYEGESFIIVNFKFEALYRSSTDGILKTVQRAQEEEYTQADLESIDPAFSGDEATYKVFGNGLMSYGLSDLKRTEGMAFYYDSGIVDADGNFVKLGGN